MTKVCNPSLLHEKWTPEKEECFALWLEVLELAPPVTLTPDIVDEENRLARRITRAVMCENLGETEDRCEELKLYFRRCFKEEREIVEMVI